MLDKQISQAIDNNDINMLRAMLQNSLSIDPTLKECTEIMWAINEKKLQIFEPHDNKVLENDKEKWTKDYFNRESTQLMFNFSKERFELLMAIAQHIYIAKPRTVQSTKSTPIYSAPSRRTRQRRAANNTGIYISAGSAIVGAIGLITSTTSLTVIGGIGIVAGIFAQVIKNK